MPAKTPDPLKGLKDRKAQLEKKLARYKKNEVSAEMVKGDGRHEEAIERIEGHLRDVNTALNKGGHSTIPGDGKKPGSK